jgi:signal transduction histidine kinase
MSHLLHPPLLEEVGLLSALQWCVEGFSERSKIPVTLDIKSGLGRYDQNVEIAVFRMVQECLTNIHRHSGSSKASVKLFESEEGLKVVVQDNGKGIPPEKLKGSGVRLGIGLLGMQQRFSQLGGDLAITSDASGTVVTARLPVQPLGPVETSQSFVIPA